MTARTKRAVCAALGCDLISYGKGYCRKHYVRFQTHGDPHAFRPGHRLRQPPLHKRPVTPLETPCREWWGAHDPNGYGRISVASVPGGILDHVELVHRYVASMLHGPLTPDQLVLHRCDNPPCFRIDHLIVGTSDQNIADMLAKERSCHGERNPHAKLTWDDVDEIRRRKAAGERTWDIANDYGVIDKTVTNIISGHTWRHERPTQ